MNTNILVVVFVALIVGAGGGYFIGARPDDTHVMPDGTEMHGEIHGTMQDGMDTMMAGLSGKTGDAFDRAFLSEMIVHHEGAVEMAEAALLNANHAEIKVLAKEIITAQTKEIEQMQRWRKEWYGN